MKPICFATRAYAYLRDEIASAEGVIEAGKIEVTHFPDGERYQRVLDNVVDRDVVLVGGTISDESTLELYDLACAIAKYGAHTLTLIVPYFGYATMERMTKPGEVVTAKTRARLLSAIPLCGSGNRCFMLDLHTDGIAHYFEGGLRTFQLYGKKLVTLMARAQGGEDFVLACTDAGRAKWVESLANDLGVSASFVFKRRLDGRNTEVSAVSAQVRDKHVVIYDDMIRTGSSLLKAADAYRQAGARDVTAVATHGVFPEDSLERIAKSGLISHLSVTNSHPNALRAAQLMPAFVSVSTVASLFREAL